MFSANGCCKLHNFTETEITLSYNQILKGFSCITTLAFEIAVTILLKHSSISPVGDDTEKHNPISKWLFDKKSWEDSKEIKGGMGIQNTLLIVQITVLS